MLCRPGRGGLRVLLQESVHSDATARLDTDVVVSPVDTAVISVLIIAVWAALGRLWWSMGIVAGLCLLLAGINRNKVQLRQEPLYPADGSFATEPGVILSMVETSTVAGVLLSVALVVLAGGAIGALLGRRFPPAKLRAPDGRARPRVVMLRVAALATSLGLLLQAASFHQPGNFWRTLYERGATWEAWSQVHNYRSNGFVGGFLYNMPVRAMEPPDGYDAATMAALAAKYTARAAEINDQRHGSLADTNVVFVLSESFTDPSWLEGINLAENPIPYTQYVMDTALSGRMHTHSYGGGTATMEFEALTGQSVGLFRPQVTSPYQMFVSDYPSYPSAVGAFAALGHRTVAIHPYELTMYKRPQVYRTLGFDTVIDAATMQSSEQIATSRYVSDAAAYDEVLYQLDRSPGPDLVNLVTMQNHGGYYYSYPDPIGSDIADPDKAEEYGQYARGLAHSDAALVDFLAALQARDEPTIVVFYGDHHPGMYTEELLAANPADATLTTPFFVWHSRTNRSASIPAITPAMFLPLLHRVADAPVPPYLALLEDVHRSVPVIQRGRLLDPAGDAIDPDDPGAEVAEVLADLRLVQYDLSMGERHALPVLWPGAARQPT